MTSCCTRNNLNTTPKKKNLINQFQWHLRLLNKEIVILYANEELNEKENSFTIATMKDQIFRNKCNERSRSFYNETIKH